MSQVHLTDLFNFLQNFSKLGLERVERRDVDCEQMLSAARHDSSTHVMTSQSRQIL